jgi:arylsulfatase A-like enzyme
VSLIDVPATILDIAGYEAGWRGFGKSLLALFEDPEAPHRDVVFGEIDQRTMIRGERFKMVVHSTGTVLSLYDLTEDPDEKFNLVGKRSVEGDILRLKDRLLGWYLGSQVRNPLIWAHVVEEKE